jgi:hypothetical protein
MAISYTTNSGLRLKMGTLKAVPTPGGDYKRYGEYRMIEFDILLASLTASPVIQLDTTVFGAPQFFIESVEVDCEVGATGGTSFSVGLIGLDGTTVESNTKFLAAVPIANHTTAGQKFIYTTGVTGAGVGIGGFATNPGFITALAAGTYTGLGRVKVRINYRGLGTITQ